MISAVNGRKRALLTKSALEWHNKRCTAQSTLCVGNKKGKTELKAMCDFKKNNTWVTIRYTYRRPKYRDASMHRYEIMINTQITDSSFFIYLKLSDFLETNATFRSAKRSEGSWYP